MPRAEPANVHCRRDEDPSQHVSKTKMNSKYSQPRYKLKERVGSQFVMSVRVENNGTDAPHKWIVGSRGKLPRTLLSKPFRNEGKYGGEFGEMSNILMDKYCSKSTSRQLNRGRRHHKRSSFKERSLSACRQPIVTAQRQRGQNLGYEHKRITGFLGTAKDELMKHFLAIPVPARQDDGGKARDDRRGQERNRLKQIKHPITMPVSYGQRFGERCRHSDCEKQRLPASLWDMLERRRAHRTERAEDQRGYKRAKHHLHQQSSSEEEIQKLNIAREPTKEHDVPVRTDRRYGRGYVLDTKTRRSPNEDHTLPIRRHDRNPLHRTDDHHRHVQKPMPVRVKRRALLQESSSSSDSSSETLVISKPVTPKPHKTVEFIKGKRKEPHVTQQPYRQKYSTERELSRFQRAAAKESHARKHHAQLVRDALKLNREEGFLPEMGPRGGHAKDNMKKESSESETSSEYSHSHFVKSAAINPKQEETYHARAKSTSTARAEKQRLVTRLSQRRLTSDKSTTGLDHISAKDFVDFLVTLSRNTVGTLTNKRKAMRLFRSYLNGECNYGRSNQGDLAKHLRKTHRLKR